MSTKAERKAELYAEISTHSKNALNNARKMNLYVSMFEPSLRKTLDISRVQNDVAALKLQIDALKAALDIYKAL